MVALPDYLRDFTRFAYLTGWSVVYTVASSTTLPNLAAASSTNDSQQPTTSALK